MRSALTAQCKNRSATVSSSGGEVTFKVPHEFDVREIYRSHGVECQECDLCVCNSLVCSALFTLNMYLRNYSETLLHIL